MIGLLFIATSLSSLALEKLAPGEQKAAENVNLTDEQRYESQTYIHEGLTQRKIEEACEKLDDPAACDGQGSTKFLGMDSNLVKGIARMYSYFSGAMGAMGGGGGSGDSDGGSQRDYCAFIPAAGEMVAGAVQQAEQQKIQNTPVSSQNAQKERLYQAARSHGTRAKTAKMQGTVWGATTGCYGIMMATGKKKFDKKMLLKAGAAGFLTMFWLKEAKQQKKYEDEVKKIADSLPGEGDCNPHTETHCYCSQPETMYDPQHCIDPVRGKKQSETAYQVPCTTSNGDSDPQCLCIGESNCMDTAMFSNMKLPGITSFANSSAGNEARNLFRGTLSSADLNSSSGKRAAVKKLYGQLESQLEDTNAAPSPEQVKISKELEAMGMPPKLARHMAMSNTNSFGKTKAARLTSSTGPSKVTSDASTNMKRSNVLSFEGGHKSIGAKKQASSSNPSIANMMRKYQNKGNRGSNSKVLQFSRQAQESASIHRNNDRPIFEIISRRYMISGRKHLKVD